MQIGIEQTAIRMYGPQSQESLLLRHELRGVAVA